MACVQGHIQRLGEVGLTASRLGAAGLSARRIGGVGLQLHRIGDVAMTVSRTGAVGVSVGIICTIPVMHPYLNVEPDYLWLTRYNNYTGDVDVISNVVWDVN